MLWGGVALAVVGFFGAGFLGIIHLEPHWAFYGLLPGLAVIAIGLFWPAEPRPVVEKPAPAVVEPPRRQMDGPPVEVRRHRPEH